MASVADGCYIGGARRAGAGKPMAIRSPWSGAIVAEIVPAAPADVDVAVASATAAAKSWRWVSRGRRATALTRFAAMLDEHADELARLQVAENGKLLKEMRGQASLFGEHLRYYAHLLAMPYGQVLEPPTGGIRVHTEVVPLGVVAALTPFNSPLNLLLWKLGPALAEGNAVVAKPSEFTPLSTLRLAELATEAGIPDGLFNVVTGGADVGVELIANRSIAKIAFTGSSATGEAVARAAANGLRRISLELGGKSANIIFADADLDQAVAGATAGIFGASGQTCMAGSRILVEASCYEHVLEALVAAAEGIKIGDPLDDSTDMGSVASVIQLQKIETMVVAAVDAGAMVAAGGRRAYVDAFPDGLFYRPTVLTDVSPDFAVWREEVFGPVACVVPFADEEEALRLADDTSYGLAAGVWTSDLRRADRVAAYLDAGTVWVNNYRKVAYNIPFGGVRASGIGRENGAACLEEYSEIKAVWVDQGLGISDPFNPRA